MNASQYQILASRTLPEDMPRLSPEESQLLLAVLGMAGEVGELVEHVKKHIYHDQPLNKEYVQKELGDVSWYWAALHTALHLDADQTLKGNLAKLMARYPDGFSPEASVAKMDEQPGPRGHEKVLPVKSRVPGIGGGDG